MLPISPTHIASFAQCPTKVFLMDKKWDPYLANEEKYSIFDLLQYLEKYPMKIGAIIDLNRSLDYYNFTEIQNQNVKLSDIKYIKFNMETDVPPDNLIDQIYDTLKEFHIKNEVVIIHCFNGLNRTGFVIVDFLCRYFNYSLEKSLNLFEIARGHVIENEKLRKALVEKFGHYNKIEESLTE